MYTLTINNSNAAKDAEFSIPGLGTYKNGSTNAVSKEEAEAFRAYQVSSGMPDVTLLQAFKGDPSVTVETESSSSGSGSSTSTSKGAGDVPPNSNVAGSTDTSGKEGDK